MSDFSILVKMETTFDLEAFLDEHETQKLVEFTLSTPEMTVKEEEATCKDKMVKKASVYYRERRKNEVEYLVSKKRSLEAELEKLHEHKLSQEVEAKRLKLKAEEQHNLLRCAEDENSSLRDKILSQMNTLKLLESFFMSQSAICVFSHSVPTNPLYVLPREPTARHNHFRDTIAIALNEVDSVMAATPLTPFNAPSFFIRVYEFPSVTIEQMSNALWKLIHYQVDLLIYTDPTAHAEVLETLDPDTLYTRYRCQLVQGQPLVESYSVCHRTIAEHETRIVYRCYLDDECFPSIGSSTRHDENGYLVIFTHPVTNATTVKMVSFLRPLANAANAPVGLVTEEFMSYLHDATTVGFRILQQNLKDAGVTLS
ncbi:hypothetical protein LEN26_017022 [Aphanomyces euteiches]|nr:hypothetical protein LEN26_017022 [Aphanomyces euteiches]